MEVTEVAFDLIKSGGGASILWTIVLGGVFKVTPASDVALAQIRVRIHPQPHAGYWGSTE